MTTGRLDPAVTISDAGFAAVQRYVYREIGLALSDSKRALVVSRLVSRMRALGLRSFRQYVARAERDEAERQLLIDAITTNETRFFREPAHFELLRREVLPALASQRPRRVHVWSAGCASGEEPYSVAMLLLEHLPPSEGWSLDVLATDISARVLTRAAAGVYPIARRGEIPPELLRKYFLRGVRARDGQMAVSGELREVVRFGVLNLNDATAYPTGAFDLVFCRNVLIYFDGATRRRVADALLTRLAPDGLLFLGHAESLGGHAAVRNVIPNVYARQRDPA